jgi:hypothetical protein
MVNMLSDYPMVKYPVTDVVQNMYWGANPDGLRVVGVDVGVNPRVGP